MNSVNLVQEHYSLPDMLTRIEDALREAGFASGTIPWSDLAQLDQFHVRGLAASKELAEGLHLNGKESVLDVGSGLGGPARYLAAVQGCHVTGIELTTVYVEIAAMLSERSGLSDRTQFVQGDALAMPFESESFDHAWTQHVAMNIADKDTLYREIYRVLKPGGKLAIYDAVKGENEPVIYPVPWAFDPGISFLISLTEMRDALQSAGFHTVSEVDTNDAALAWFGELQKAQQAAGGIPPLNLASIGGPGVRQGVANFAQNIKEGRVRVVQVIVQKSEIKS